MKISSVYEMPADKYNELLAEALKQIEEFEQPEWVVFVKSGVAKKRPPQEKDFWYKRAASILRQIYINKVVGVNRLKTRYGSKKNRGMRPERFRKGSGKIIRVILQKAEQVGFLEKHNEPGKRAGRRLTEKGKEFLEGIKQEEKTISKTDNLTKQEDIQTEAKDNENQSDKVEKDIEKKEEAKEEIIEKEIKKTEKEIAEDVVEGADKKEIEKDIKEAKQEIKEDIEIKEDKKEKENNEN